MSDSTKTGTVVSRNSFERTTQIMTQVGMGDLIKAGTTRIRARLTDEDTRLRQLATKANAELDQLKADFEQMVNDLVAAIDTSPETQTIAFLRKQGYDFEKGDKVGPTITRNQIHHEHHTVGATVALVENPEADSYRRNTIVSRPVTLKWTSAMKAVYKAIGKQTEAYQDLQSQIRDNRRNLDLLAVRSDEIHAKLVEVITGADDDMSPQDLMEAVNAEVNRLTPAALAGPSSN